MGKNLAEQQDTTTKLKTNKHKIYHQLHSHLHHVHRNLQKRALFLMLNYVALEHSDCDPFTSERHLPLQMGLIGNVVGFFILLTAGYESLALF